MVGGQLPGYAPWWEDSYPGVYNGRRGTTRVCTTVGEVLPGYTSLPTMVGIHQPPYYASLYPPGYTTILPLTMPAV